MIRNALIIRKPWIDYILAGNKTWEMRGTRTARRGGIALIRKGSGLVVATAELVGVEGPFDRSQMLATIDKHHISADKIESGEVDKWPYAWKLEQVHCLPQPVPYVHRNGAVIWATLDDAACEGVQAQVAALCV